MPSFGGPNDLQAATQRTAAQIWIRDGRCRSIQATNASSYSTRHRAIGSAAYRPSFLMSDSMKPSLLLSRR